MDKYKVIITTSLFLLFFLNSCSSIDKNIPISHVKIKQQGMHQNDRPKMANTCKGFILTEQQVLDFYIYSSLVNENLLSNKYKILPCYISGTAYIYGELFSWRIRSGGIGEFFNDNKRFLKVCGKNCCKKATGIC